MITIRVVFFGMVLIGLVCAATALRAQTGGDAYVANSGSNDVSAYSIDATTGALTPVPGSPFPAGTAPSSVTTTAGPRTPPTLKSDQFQLKR